MSLIARGDGRLRRSSLAKVLRERKRVTVLQTRGNAITKKRISYLEGVTRELRDGREVGNPNPLLGRTYEVSIDEHGEVTVSRAGKRHVSAIERDHVLQDNRSLGAPDPFSLMLQGRTLRPGDGLSAEADAIAAFETNGIDARRVSLTFVGLETRERRRLARFDLTMDLVQHEGPVAMQVRFDGVLLVDPATSWPVAIRLAGPMQVHDAQRDDVSIEGDGRAELEVTLEVIRK